MKTVDRQDEHLHTIIVVTLVLGRGDKQQVDTQASSKHLWSFMGASWSLLGAPWGALGSHWGSQIKHCHKGFVCISASGRFGVCKAAGTYHSCSLSASWRPPGCLLGVSWEPLGVLLGAIRCHKMNIFAQVLQTFPFLGALWCAKLQALTIYPP